jgi:tRNA-modifying protein YgfZ
MTGYEAFYESAAVVDVSARGRIAATGEDRKRLIHAMTTNQVEKLETGEGVYAFFLNAQGRVLADAVVVCREESLLLMVEAEAREKVYGHIDRYIIADDVTLEDVTEKTWEVALEGPGAAEVLRGLGAELPGATYGFTRWGDVEIVAVSMTGAGGYRLIGSEGRAEVEEKLKAGGAVEASLAETERVRVEHGVPRYGVEITDGYIAQETRQMQALNFAKGCYLGQEIVERVRSRGHVNRLLTALELAGESVPERGTKVMWGEKEAGEVMSAVWSPRLGAVRAMGYVRAEALAAGGLTIDGAEAKAVE